MSSLFGFVGVQWDLWALSEICGRSKNFAVAQTDLQSFKKIYARSALIAQKSTAEKPLPCAKKFKTAAGSAHCTC